MVISEDVIMTQAQINCFFAVVEEASFAKAANTLFISQPAVSKSISKLEEELGFPLLERKGGTLHTTTAGNMLYNYLKKAKADFNSLISSINSSLSEPSGTIRLGCPETWNPNKFYSKIMNHFQERFPAVELIFDCHRLPSLMSKLQNGKIDMLMTHEFHPAVQHGLTIRHLTDSRCGILYSKTFFKDIHSLADLKNVDFLHFDSDIEKKFDVLIRKFCAEYGFTPTLKNCGQFSSALFNLSCGKGVMFFTTWDNALANSSYSFLPLDYISPINLIYSSTSSNPNIKIFADELETLFADDEIS